jgi:hypothetical protein
MLLSSLIPFVVYNTRKENLMYAIEIIGFKFVWYQFFSFHWLYHNVLMRFEWPHKLVDFFWQYNQINLGLSKRSGPRILVSYRMLKKNEFFYEQIEHRLLYFSMLFDCYLRDGPWLNRAFYDMMSPEKFWPPVFLCSVESPLKVRPWAKISDFFNKTLQELWRLQSEWPPPSRNIFLWYD